MARRYAIGCVVGRKRDYSSFTTAAGLPCTITFSGTSVVTTAPEPMTLSSPTVTPGLTTARPPI